jgi:hypothetical protein
LQQQVLEWHNAAEEYREVLLSVRDLPEVANWELRSPKPVPAS